MSPMKLFKRKHLWIYAMVFMFVYFSFLHYKTFVDYSALKKDEKVYTEKIAYELAKQEELQDLDEKASSQKTVESIARSSLNYLKEGEILFVDSEKR
ncbi:MAG: septum formation initiator family protein [Clostridia bacterium]|nr:septum formation initiator family protein [Clostridia bacterium]